jgi:uncharacterized membrane protein YgcG
MEKLENKDTYFRAKQYVDCLRGFYSHLTVYLIINILISSFKILRNLENGETFNDAFFDFSTIAVWMFWGIGLSIHAFKVFGFPFILGRNWEEEKIKQYMNEETQNQRE